MRVRKREEDAVLPIYLGTTYIQVGSRPWSKLTDYSYTYPLSLPSFREVTWDDLHPGPPYKSGGPFDKREFHDNAFEVRNQGTHYGTQGYVSYKYVGGFTPIVRGGTLLSSYGVANISDILTKESSWDDFGDSYEYGATGWNRFRPGRASADLGVFIGEFKDVPRMLKSTAKGFHELWRSMGGSRTSFAPKSVANHWLNTQFGWLPFISDLRKFYKTYKNQDLRLKAMIRNNGRWMRRGGTVKAEYDRSTVASSATTAMLAPALSTSYYSAYPIGSYSIDKISYDDVWFEGAFRYYIPDIGSVQWRRRALLEMYGAMPCPSLIWELTPWSWLVDWFSNFGDVISNLSDNLAENLAAKYAYIMRKRQIDFELKTTLLLKSGTYNDTWKYDCTTKRRVEANPFGFSLSSEFFSARQWSILAALGITRLKF